MTRLEVGDHDRYREGLAYVYPVVSRRARGVSVGVNLSPNDACNWRCNYCQVPGLVRGKGPPIDLERLERELDALLADVVHGDFLRERVPEGSRRLNDVALSGNGEPTGSPDFGAAVEVVGRALARVDLRAADGTPRPGDAVRIVLITNGSLVHKPEVARGLARLAALGGEAWFKLDAASDEGLARINDAATGIERQLANLEACAHLVPTWVQTAVFERERPASAGGGREPVLAGEADLWLARLARLVATGVPLRGVHLYGLAREVFQPEAVELRRVDGAVLEGLAARVRALGLEATVSP